MAQKQKSKSDVGVKGGKLKVPVKASTIAAGAKASPAKSGSKSAVKTSAVKAAVVNASSSKGASSVGAAKVSNAKVSGAKGAHVAAKSAVKTTGHKSKVAMPATKVGAHASTKVAAAKPKPSAPKPMTAAAIAASRPRPVAPPASARAVPAAIGKPAAQRISAPAPVAAAPTAATPKQLAEKAAAARGAMAQAKKPVSARHGFKTNEFVVYPAHGVGRIVGIEEQEIAGMSLELFVITFDKEKLTLRVPTGKLASVGMRKLAEEPLVKRAMETLKGRARVKRTMWSRRAQEYVAKINSGDLISIAEVVRDLYRSEAQPEQSYSERQLYEDALERMAREIAAVERLDERGAVQRIVEILSKSAKGRRAAADAAEAAEVDIKAA
jgi:CarD family transcriptional regulator